MFYSDQSFVTWPSLALLQIYFACCASTDRLHIPHATTDSLHKLIASACADIAAGNIRDITIVTQCFHGNKYWQQICDMARPNFLQYADQNHYGLRFFTHTFSIARNPSWLRVPLTISAFRMGAIFVFYTDADSWFVRHAPPIAAFLPGNGKQLAILQDLPFRNCFNTGQYVLRAGKWATDFMHEVWSHTAGNEQPIFNLVLGDNLAICSTSSTFNITQARRVTPTAIHPLAFGCCQLKGPYADGVQVISHINRQIIMHSANGFGPYAKLKLMKFLLAHSLMPNSIQTQSYASCQRAFIQVYNPLCWAINISWKTLASPLALS